MGSGPHNGAFSLVHHELLDDAKFEAVYEDDAAFACWVRLLIAADKTYPAPAPIPFGTKPRALKALVDANLITRMPHGHYIVVGMKAERERRAALNERYRKAANARWHPDDSDAPAS